MKTIWYFGDSSTEDYNLKFNWVKNYIDWKKGYIPPHWTKLLANKMNLSYKNFGKNGLDNYSILDSIIEQMNNIKDEDMIIINWTSPIRYRVANGNKFYSITVERIDKTIENISIQSLQEFALNRESTLWIDEVINWMKLLKKLFLNNKIIFWTPFIEYNNVKGIFRTSLMRKNLTINEETNGVICDYHMGENGCKEFTELIYNYINKKDII
jgi:hypothetical protein